MAGAAVAEGGVASAAFPWGSGAPGAFAAWLLPGKLLVGRYPFVDCDRCWRAPPAADPPPPRPPPSPPGLARLVERIERAELFFFLLLTKPLRTSPKP